MLVCGVALSPNEDPPPSSSGYESLVESFAFCVIPQKIMKTLVILGGSILSDLRM